MKLVIYQSHFNKIGGCETFIYNLCQQLKDYYDILVLYDTGDMEQISRIREFVDVEKIDAKKDYECDILIQNSMWNNLNTTIKAKRVIGMVHTDYQKLQCKIDIQFDLIDDFVGCGENASTKFTEKYGVKCTPIKNILGILQPTKRIYHFISAGRLSNDKGWGRMQQMIRMLREAGILFDWVIFTDAQPTNEFEEVKFMKPRYDIWSYIKNADYGVLLSDAEGYPYFDVECLQYSTPLIVTKTSGHEDIVVNGVNGYLVPLDMKFDINIIKKIPKVSGYENGTTKETWINYLGGGKYKKRKPKSKKFKVECLYVGGYYDMQLDRKIKFGEQIIVNDLRAEYLVKNKAVKIIEEVK